VRLFKPCELIAKQLIEKWQNTFENGIMPLKKKLLRKYVHKDEAND